MPAPRLVAVAIFEQWQACALDRVRVAPDEQVLELDGKAVVAPGGVVAAPARAGLAVDRACFVYHGVPEEGRIERVRWLGAGYAEAGDVLSPEPPPPMGDFTPAAPLAGAVRAVALAADDEGRLFVVDDADGAVAVDDLADRRLLQRVRLPGPALDVAAHGMVVFALCDHAERPLWRLGARRPPVQVPTKAQRLVRIAMGSSGRLWGLTDAGRIVAVDDPSFTLGTVAGATDLEVAGDGAVIVADRTGAEFHRFSTADGVTDRRLRPAVARHYDGAGIVRMPDGSIGFWTTTDRLRRTVAAVMRYEATGAAVAGPLDSWVYGETWGRVLVDACVPDKTSLSLAAYVSDDPEDEPAFGPMRPVHCRETGSDVPWAQPDPADPYETLEAPVGSARGRYLWLRLELRGTTKATPRVRAMRAEHPGHDLVRRLPQTYSRDPLVADFLYRYLAIAAGLVGDVERRADERQVLLDPDAAPVSVLPWLGGLVGMSLDNRWSELARRTLVREAACLFRKRGTKAGLERLIEIYLGPGRPPRIVELYQVRGQGGGMLGGAAGSTAWSSAVVGGGLRVGGAAGAAHATPLEGTPQDSFSRSAHRFSVVIPALLDDQQERAVRDLLEEHKPAHTAFELCTVGAGMRVGRGLYLDLTSIVGPGSGFEQLRLGDSALGRDGLLGRAASSGIRPGSARLGRTTRVDG